jgi:hypothetical protein
LEGAGESRDEKETTPEGKRSYQLLPDTGSYLAVFDQQAQASTPTYQ